MREIRSLARPRNGSTPALRDNGARLNPVEDRPRAIVGNDPSESSPSSAAAACARRGAVLAVFGFDPLRVERFLGCASPLL